MSLSGFPEWFPEGHIIEQLLLDHIREVPELHGFSGIEMKAVGTLEQLEAKGEVSKEVYVLDHLQAAKEAEAGRRSSKERRVGLHFDPTAPFAHCAIENANELDFPFKYYQVQKVWCGKHPQERRFREFTQVDIDVVGEGPLLPHFEANLPLIMAQALAGPPILKVTVLVNDHKVAQEVYGSLRADGVEAALRGLDKIDKIGPEGVTRKPAESGISGEQVETLLVMVQIRSIDPTVIRNQIDVLSVSGKLLDGGVLRLYALLESAARRVPRTIPAGLKIARGFDCYTGSMYGSVAEGHKDLGSICSGSRYDSLAKDGKHMYPSVGLSIGVSRLVSRMTSMPVTKAARKVPSATLAAVNDGADRARSGDIVVTLRSKEIVADIALTAAKFGKQIKFVDKRGAPFAWLPDTDVQGDTVKDIRSGLQTDADSSTQTPSQEDLRLRIPTLD